MKPIAEWRAAAQSLHFRDYDIAYWRTENRANKPTLLLIHGFPTSSWDWSAMWDALAERFTLIAPDMLGFGLSDKPRNIQYQLHDQADLHADLLDLLGVRDAHILAHDYGVSVAQELLARQIDETLTFNIHSVCFLNGGLFPEMHRPRPIQKIGISPLGPIVSRMLSRDKLRKGFDEIFGPETKASDAEIDTHWSLITEKDGNLIFHKLLRYMIDRRELRDRWVGALETSTIPMKLINGGADPVSGEHLYRHFKTYLPQANADLLPAIGHYPQTEAPNEVLQSFFAFHDKISERSA